MMTNCPRCGFYQNKDQYCAKCGVDMVAYRPVEKPVWQRVLRNTVFQLLALVVLILVLFSFARNLRHREVEERIAEVESSRPSQVISPRHAPTPAEQRTELASTAATQAHAATETAAAIAAPEPAPAPPEPRRTHVAATSARVVFASIAHPALDTLVASADPATLSTQGPFLSGVVTNLADKMKAAQSADNWSILDQSARPLHIDQVVEYYGGTKDEVANQFLGFVVELTPLSAEENATSLQLRAWRYLRDAMSPQVDELSLPLPDNYVVPSGGGIFISGILPKRPLSETERHFYEPMKVLNLLANEEYRRGASDLVIFIEPK